jgi:transcription-repair coupling factor (mfd)
LEDYITSTASYKSFLKNPELGASFDRLEGLPLATFLSLLSRKMGKRIVVVVPTEENLSLLEQNLSLIDGVNALYLHGTGKLFYQGFTGSRAEYESADVLSRFSALKNGLLVTSLRTFSAPVVSQQLLSSKELRFAVHDKFDPAAISQKLSESGYYRSNGCYEEGTYVIRGEVMEIFPFSSDYPVRIYSEWDEIAKIVFFDPQTQQKKKEVGHYAFNLLPLSGFLPQSSIAEYLRVDDYFVFLGRERLEVVFKSLQNEVKAAYKEAYSENKEVPTPDKYLFDSLSFMTGRQSKIVIYDIANPSCLHFDIGPSRSYFGNVTFFKEDAVSMLRDGWRIEVLASSQVQLERLSSVMQEVKGISFSVADASEGFTIDDKKYFAVLDQEIFGRRKQRQKAVVNVKSAPIDSFIDLKPGDYVVHINYGIGEFMKIERVKTSRTERDYIKIRYQNEEYLYVPIEQADLVQRYIGSDGRKPKLDSMGGSGWTKKKERALKNAEELATQLVALYAKRQNTYGHAFTPDNDWQLQFEASFPFTETPDQLKCVEDIKRDMESDKVMDRLVCGDVGYGKTEIAFRAAFKAVMDGRQVAFLAPTTILAEQHYRKFMERVGSFPVKAGLLTRIVKPRDAKKTLADLADGRLDVLFGTHKILQKNVVFKRLGLLICDEEQRFGVRDKEKIKQLKVNVDSLALSATPIPRTLYMSLLKVRDMSLLTTAPRERLPINTIIRDYDPDIVFNAIRKEVQRGGQVFYLHNRIEDLADITYQLRNALPGLIVEYAHGQMNSDEMEDIMHRFIYEGVQVLVSTTIIENGIDIPNVNTIIIDRADRFGLSQLYQLRGRVGRSDRQAYCYLMYPDESKLNDDAIKRLKVLSENTSLGSGFKVAMKDMEIRGAGNILGREQSGQLEAIGLDLYMKILDEQIKKLTDGETQGKDREVYLELDYSGFIPDTYVRDPAMKMEMYKKIASVKDELSLEALRSEFEDRFGPIPEEVDNLLCIARVKTICHRLEIYHLSESHGIVQLEFSHVAAVNVSKVMRLISRSGGRVKADPARPNYLRMETSAVSLKDKAVFILEQLESII